MLRKLIIFIFGISFCLGLYAQKEARLDTIYMLGRKKLLVNITGITYNMVKYTEPGSDQVKTMEKKVIQRVVFDSGRKEVFNDPLIQDIEETDWRSVVLTENKEDVGGLFEIGKVTGRSASNNKTAKIAERNAIITLKKQAAGRGGVMVLVTKKEAIGGFGEVPTYYMEGIAYSFEKPQDDN